MSSQKSKLATVGLIAFLIVATMAGAIFGLIAFLHSDAGSLSALMSKLADIIAKSKASLPVALHQNLPENTPALQEALVKWLHEHALEMQHVGKEALHGFALVVIGIVIGAMASIREAEAGHARGALAIALGQRLEQFGVAFRQIVFAQAKIAAINATATGIYLLVVLPLLGIKLPLGKTMVALTFLFGLVPVVGNLVSNSVIVVISLGHSLGMALASLVFLVVVHKAEYFLNARIIGNAIKSHAIELLLAMLVMESAFGIAGVILAPILYAYLKMELKAQRLI